MKSPRFFDSAEVLDAGELRRVRDLVGRLGPVAAGRKLGVGRLTLDTASTGGKLRPDTRRRLLEALARVEPA